MYSYDCLRKEPNTILVKKENELGRYFDVITPVAKKYMREYVEFDDENVDWDKITRKQFLEHKGSKPIPESRSRAGFYNYNAIKTSHVMYSKKVEHHY